MPEITLLRQCAPTLAGIKTGGMFIAEYDDEESMQSDLDNLNMMFREKGLVVTCLRFRAGKALIYVYRPCKLRNDLTCEEARAILERYGYDVSDDVSCLDHLTGRISACQDFPHEVGLFLGYPPEDVKGFIEQGGRAYKACGTWKVYGDVAEAEKLFHKYSKCTNVYLSCWEKGATLSRLIVSLH